MMQCDAFIELAYLSWLFSPLEGPITVLHPAFLICEASLIASVLAGVPMCAIRIKVDLICGGAIFSLLRLSITLSNPIPNPTINDRMSNPVYLSMGAPMILPHSVHEPS